MSNNDDDIETPNENFNYDLFKLDLTSSLGNKISSKLPWTHSLIDDFDGLRECFVS